MEIKVEIYSGSGNIFSVIDNRVYGLDSLAINENLQKFVNIDSHRVEGILLLNGPEKHYNFIAEFFNPDGSNGMMCGNGGRVIIEFADKLKLIQKHKAKFRISNIEYEGFVDSNTNEVTIIFPPPKQFIDNIHIEVENKLLTIGFVDVGTEHAVINTKQLPINFDINEIGKQVRNNYKFGTKGANANFYEVVNSNTINLRTFERGVEAETGACGTGAISTSIIALLRKEVNLPITIFPTSKQKLVVDILGNFPNKIESISFRGYVEKLGDTIISI